MTKPSSPSNSDDVAALIARGLTRKGMTQKELATVTGIPYSTLNAWATRRRGRGGGIKPEHLRKLAEHLDFTAKEMFEANGRQVPGDLNEEREAEMLRAYRNLSTEGQRALIQTAKVLGRSMRAS